MYSNSFHCWETMPSHIYTERNSSLVTQLNNNWKGLCWEDIKMIFSYFYAYNSCFKL